MPTEIRTMVAAPNGLKGAVVQRGPRWVFDLWHRGAHRCSARTAQGGRCRRHVNLQAGVSRYCERHRDEHEPVYYLQATQREEACPCGCGYNVLTLVLEAALIGGQPRHQQPLRAVAGNVDLLRKTS
jgi:hypothetical protein